MQHLIVDLKRWAYNKSIAYDIYADWHKSVTPKALKNHYSIAKWFDAVTIPLQNAKHDIPVSVDVVQFDKNDKGAYVCAFEYDSHANALRVYVSSLNVSKRGLFLRIKSLPYLFTEHFFQRIVDRKSIHEKDKLLQCVFDEYKEKQGLITFLYGYAALNDDAVFFPVPFLGGLALVNAIVNDVSVGGYIINAGFSAKTNGTVKASDDIYDPIHSRTVKDVDGNEYFVGLRASTWISCNELLPAQEKFSNLVQSFYEENQDFLDKDMYEHLSGQLSLSSQRKYIELVDEFTKIVNSSLSPTERKAAFFEPKAAKNAEKVKTV